jgi:hypothetical protein
VDSFQNVEGFATTNFFLTGGQGRTQKGEDK